MLVIQRKTLLDLLRSIPSARNGKVGFRLGIVDGGDVLTEFRDAPSAECMLVIGDQEDARNASDQSLSAIVLLKPLQGNISAATDRRLTLGERVYEVSVFRVREGAIVEDEAIFAPIEEDIFSRIDGLFETDVLSGKQVLLVGLGSGGSPIALELAKSGVQNFTLIDFDRLEVGNLARHVAGLPDLGRYKTLAMRDLLLAKNPYAKIRTLEVKAEWTNRQVLDECIDEADLVICGTDNRESKMLINRACVDLSTVCIYGGAFRRAYGGQILRVRPKDSICYQCFIEALPQFAGDQEISNERQLAAVQYSPDDPGVSIEPGLSIDISPISLMIAKLSLLELLRGEETTFGPLYEDFVAAWYLWLNRREAGSDYEDMKPLGYNVNEMSIMRWYGVELDRNPACAVCGDFHSRFDVELNQEDLDLFRNSRGA